MEEEPKLTQFSLHSLAISDFEVVRRGLKNLLIAVVISIFTSTAYFLISPLHSATSELLSRTTPTIWDVFIAFAGGMAGAIGATRREKNNVIPGVAIATALMPPLCTAGFGLATGHFYYVLGAFYLFFINSVFICIATLLVLRFMKFHRREFESEVRRKRMVRYIWFVGIVTVAPSIWLGYRIVQKAIFEGNAQAFVRKEFKFPRTQVVSKTFLFERRKTPEIELLLIGETLDSARIDSLNRRLPDYKLDGTRLVIRQGLDARNNIDFAQIKASILHDVFHDDDSTLLATTPSTSGAMLPDLSAELKALFPQIDAYSIARSAVIRTDTLRRNDS